MDRVKLLKIFPTEVKKEWGWSSLGEKIKVIFKM